MFQLSSLPDQFQPAGVRQMVEDVAANAFSLDQAGSTQLHELLRDIRLAQPQHGFEMANARPFFADGQHDQQARGLPEQGKGLRQRICVGKII